ncbi:hypothetical protein [Hymenobacter koreensis]|uniref:YcxB family protein n=1 Tax=Hymenobacter koreensis TaxID=1084523 RepID=A0ABP8JI36_9BACT
MQQPNNMRGRQVAQQPSPLAIRTKKYQLDKNTYTRMALTQVWKRDWWQAVIPLVALSLPAVFWFSWWWIAAAVLVTILYVLLRSAQVTGVTQMEQSKALFERVNYEMDQRQVLLRLNQEQGMRLTWDMIESVRKDNDAYVMYLKQPDLAGQVAGWRAWAAKIMYVPVFLHLPTRIFNSANDLRLFESILRRKGFLPAETAAPEAGGKAA